MRGGARKGAGGKQPGAGRKPNAVQTYRTTFMLTKDQQDEARNQGGSPWLQGLLNLEIKEKKNE